VTTNGRTVRAKRICASVRPCRRKSVS